ncbi:MAG TPA: DUF4279 domain-containing protein [Polyangiales bacterium]|nr:DUF4279 domain-containing protein [Polyangiales bacterium]
MDEKTRPTISMGGPPGRVRVSLTVRGNDLDPSDLARRLQCTPDYSHRRGEPRKKGVPYADGVWEVTASGDQGASVGGLIDQLLSRIPAEAPWDEIRAACQITLGIYVLLTSENQDFMIPPTQLARLARIGAELWCDIYSDSSS